MKKIKDKNIKDTFRPIVGIDLGTTNSAVAYIYRKKPKIITSPKGEKIIPSVVLIDLNGNVVIGKDARDSMVAMPDRTVAAVKRKMGSNEGIQIADKVLLPEEVAALILKELKKYVDDLLGEGEKEAVITVPAYFTDKQRRATKKAGELAGFVVERIINEPTAAAMAYGLNNLKEDRHILVYDLGGGTFDVSIVEMMSGILEVKASTGNNFLGGEDFDWRLVDWFAEKIIKEHGVDPRKDIRAKALLKDEAERTKKQLSTENKVEISLPIVTVKNNQPISLSVEITRKEFEELIKDLLMETMEHVETVLKETSLTAKDIDDILLVGGSTRIPLVHELISDFFKKKPRNDINPDEAVALGAAVQAGIKSGVLAKSGMIVTDVAPFSMGIAVLKEWKNIAVRPGGYHVIIPRNTTIPVTRTEEFTTVYDGQTKVAIEIFQGENDWVKYNHKLGEFLLDGIPPNEAGREKIQVTFKYNLNGILEVTAKCEATGKEMSVTVQDALERESQEAYEDSIDKLNTLFENKEEDDLDEGLYSQMIDEIANDMVSELEEDRDLDDLLEEAEELIDRAKDLEKISEGEKLKRIDNIIRKLKKAVLRRNKEKLEDAIDRATDELIDIEL
ncbi:Hsp70 family protein [Paramaledivibacter caminithermalis]|uniref:Chaperone protein DnaK n=1 Tax=Paramaledivibacter caminithermalis (strain DSM 15212 / CIP 107654 / DViRD3) TaxID=1121301 RepID=A0A1M6L578_PARC5|nr:Hsp70 family protein [Paramaledivibacter caminithermalis]SHJ66372.1 molecular chaperone DnaK [Paramaledivibacter caminithermalis DSM 15212]